MVSIFVHKGAFLKRHQMVRKDVNRVRGIEEYFLEEMKHEQGLKGSLRSHGARYGKNQSDSNSWYLSGAC